MAGGQIGVGDIVDGRYRVERVLGRGGMGLVVAAVHLRLRHKVAIKFPLSKADARGTVVERLLREARATMQLRSEHVARVYDIGMQDGVGPFLVMDHLVGQDLGRLLSQSGPLPCATAVEYMLQTCEALAEAHARGIVHRDLKPSNLFLTKRADGSPLVKIIDFGLAKIIDTKELALTESSALLGSPLFMAPEQMRGGASADARVDIWAVGATLHTLLTASPPFPGKNLLDVYDRIRQGAPRLRDRQPMAAAGLEVALFRCLSIQPEERYADVAELADALASVEPTRFASYAKRAREILAQSDLAADVDAKADSAGPHEHDTLNIGRNSATVPPRGASWADEPQASRAKRFTSDPPLSISASGQRPPLPTRKRRVVLTGLTLALVLTTLSVLRWGVSKQSSSDHEVAAATPSSFNGGVPITARSLTQTTVTTQPTFAPPREVSSDTASSSRPHLVRDSAPMRNAKSTHSSFVDPTRPPSGALDGQDPLADPD